MSYATQGKADSSKQESKEESYRKANPAAHTLRDYRVRFPNFHTGVKESVVVSFTDKELELLCY